MKEGAIHAIFPSFFLLHVMFSRREITWNICPHCGGIEQIEKYCWLIKADLWLKNQQASTARSVCKMQQPIEIYWPFKNSIWRIQKFLLISYGIIQMDEWIMNWTRSNQSQNSELGTIMSWWLNWFYGKCKCQNLERCWGAKCKVIAYNQHSSNSKFRFAPNCACSQ